MVRERRDFFPRLEERLLRRAERERERRARLRERRDFFERLEERLEADLDRRRLEADLDREHLAAAALPELPLFMAFMPQERQESEATTMALLRVRKWWRFCTAATYSFHSFKMRARRRLRAAPAAAPPYASGPAGAPYSLNAARPPPSKLVTDPVSDPVSDPADMILVGEGRVGVNLSRPEKVRSEHDPSFDQLLFPSLYP